MKKRTVLLILGLVILAISFAWLGYDWLRSNSVDTSWVETTDTLLRNYSGYINDSAIRNPQIAIQYLRMYEYQNGTENLLYYGTGDNETLVKYLESLLTKATIQKGIITQSHLDEIRTFNRAVGLDFRLSDPSNQYSKAYFVLEDNLNQDIRGTIIVETSPSSILKIIAVSKIALTYLALVYFR